MTILEKNKMFNKLITNGYVQKKEEKGNMIYKYILNKNKIHCIDRFCEYDINTDYMINNISLDARRAYYIENILKSVGIIINDIEENYDVLASSSFDIVLCKNENNIYTFIEFNDQCYDNYGKNIKIVKLNLNSRNLKYDHIDLQELKYYHADSKISNYTLSKMDKWKKYRITQNNLYDVMAKDTQKKEFTCAWESMNQYGDFICDLDINKLDKNIFEIKKEEGNKTKIYCR